MTDYPILPELEGFDVIVVGAGTAGLPTALSCLQHGLRVLVLEKDQRFGGTLWITGASYSAAGTRLQKAKGIEDSWQEHMEDANRIGHGYADQELLELVMQQSAAGVDWLEQLGLDFGDSPQLGPEHELYSKPRTHYQLVNVSQNHPGVAGGVQEGTGLNMLRLMRAHIMPYMTKGQCVMLRGHAVTDLLMDGDRCTGVVVDRGGNLYAVHAPATVIATGGYAANRDLLKRFNPEKASVLTMTSPTSQGDGILLAEKHGLKVTHTEFMNPGIGGIEDPRNPGTVMLWILINSGRPAALTGDIWVNKEGRRFVREDHHSHDFKEKTLVKQPDLTMFSIYDSAMRLPENPGLRAWILEVEGRDLNEHNVKKADTIEELAGKIGCDPAVLKKTVDDWNAAVAAGKDEEFGRESFGRQIIQAPFYALKSGSHILLTRGGVKVNTRLQVVKDDEAETPVQGLYAVGEVIGNGRLSGDASVGGLAVGPCFTFGRLLGEYIPQHLEEAGIKVRAGSTA